MHLDSLPETEDKAGKNNSWRKDEIRRELKFSEWEYAPIRSAAHELNEKLADLASRNNRAISEEQVLNPPPNPLTAETRTKLKQLKSEKRQTINTAVDSLNAALGPELANRLHQYVQSLYSGNAHYGGKRAAKLPANSIPVTASNSGGDVTKSAPRPETICGDACIDDDDDDDDDDDGGLPIDCSESEYTAPVSFSQDGMTVYGFSDEDTNSGCLAVLTGSISDNGAVRDQTEVTGSSYVAVETQYDVTVGDTYAEDTIAEVCGRYTCQTLYGASAGFKTGAPSITQISPQQVTAGAPGTFTVSGSVLAGANNETTAHSDSSGVSVNIGSGDVSTTNPSTATVNYSIDPEAPTGSASFTLSTVWGTSNTASFIVACGTPSISHLSNSNWLAGQSYTITISGSGFCSNSQVNVSVQNGGVTVSGVVVNSDSSITATVAPLATDPTEQAALTVTNDSGDNSDAVKSHSASPLTSKAANQKPRPNFTCPGCGATAATAYANVLAEAAPAPTIMTGTGSTGVCGSGTPVTGNQNVVVGQPITFTGCIPSSVSSMAASETWTPANNLSAQTAVAGFNVTFDGTSKFTESLTQISTTSCGTGAYCDFNKFYFVAAGTYTFSFAYTLSNGNPSPSTSITFVVTAPTPDENGRFIEGPGEGSVTPPAAGPVQVYGKGKFTLPYGAGTNTTPVLANGDNNDTQGISLTASGNSPNSIVGGFSGVGGWMFVQIINQISFSFVTSPSSNKFVLQPGLDTNYPNGGYEYSDSPSINLDSTGTSQFTAVGEKSESIKFTDYLMWDPEIPFPGQNECQPASSRVSGTGVISYNQSTCASVPVPIASLMWGFEGDAIKTLNPAQGTGANTWILNCGSAETPTPGTGTIGYPTWTFTVNASQIPQ